MIDWNRSPAKFIKMQYILPHIFSPSQTLFWKLVHTESLVNHKTQPFWIKGVWLKPFQNKKVLEIFQMHRFKCFFYSWQRRKRHRKWCIWIDWKTVQHLFLITLTSQVAKLLIKTLLLLTTVFKLVSPDTLELASVFPTM